MQDYEKVNTVWLEAEGDMVVLSQKNNGCFETETYQFIRDTLKVGDHFVDVGAYTGLYTILAEQLGCGKVSSFEPNPAVYNRLVLNIMANNCDDNIITVYPYALSDKTHQTVMYVNPAVLLTSGGSLEHSITRNTKPVPIHSVEFDSIDFGRVDMVKIDAEGHELSVLKGMVKTIENYSPYLILEVNVSSELEKFVDFLSPYGYQNIDVFDERNYLFMRTK